MKYKITAHLDFMEDVLDLDDDLTEEEVEKELYEYVRSFFDWGYRTNKEKRKMKKATKEELLKLGFKEEEREKEKCLSLKLNKGKDRFYYFLRWYEDEPDKFYIDEFLIRGIGTISEEDFLVNTNNLSTNAIKHYKQIMEELENAN